MREQTKPTVQIEYHADDFGMFPAQSQRILRCHTDGKLNGISIMPNSLRLEECIHLLKPCMDQISVTVHLNLFEGKSLCSHDQIPSLTTPEGILNCSFGGLLLRSLLPGRASCRRQLRQEIRAQIRAVRSHLPADRPLRIDGHAHYHMLPVVFDALMDVIREDSLNVSYIRIPREYPSIYLKNRKQLQDISPINFIKVLVLNLLAWRNQMKYSKVLSTMEQKLFMGVFLSGRMYRENVEPCLADAVALAQRKNMNLELLAHPGGIFEPEDIASLTNQADVHFLTSQLRSREASMFLFRENPVCAGAVREPQ